MGWQSVSAPSAKTPLFSREADEVTLLESFLVCVPKDGRMKIESKV